MNIFITNLKEYMLCTHPYAHTLQTFTVFLYPVEHNIMMINITNSLLYILARVKWEEVTLKHNAYNKNKSFYLFKNLAVDQ